MTADETDPTRQRPHRLRTPVFLAIVLLVELLYALWNPPYHNPDELSHMQHAAWWRDEARWPDPYTEGERIQQDHHPPYTGIVSGLVLRATTDWFADAPTIRLPGPYERSLELSRSDKARVPGDKRLVHHGQLYLLRLLMALHWVLAAFFLLRVADLVWPDRPRFAFSIALACATIPQVCMNGAALTPDTPLSAFSAGALYFALSAAAGKDGARRLGLLMGLFFALALWNKSGSIFLGPTLCVAALTRAFVCRSARSGLAFFAWALLLPIVVGSWWYVRNFALWSDPFQLKVLTETYAFPMRREPATGAVFETMFWDIFRTFFGFWHREILLPRPVFFVLAGILGAAALGILLMARRGVRAEVPKPALAAIPTSIVGIATLLAMTVKGNLFMPSAQGRYLYPALAAFVVLLGTGLRIAARLRRDGRIAYAFAALWIGFGVWGFHWAVLKKLTVERARAAGEGGVLFYDDCGSAELHPHLLPGHGMTPPDEGMLGRIVPWRTVTGHPVAIVYRFPLATNAPRDDLQVRVTYYNPDTTTPFVAYEKRRFVYTSQRLRANGVLLHDEIEVTSQPKEFVFPLPRAATKGDTLELRFEKVEGIAACVSEIWIERRWVVHEGGGTVKNRTQRRLPLVLVTKDGERTNNLEVTIEPNGVVQANLASDPIVVLGRHSPWMLREAESHPAPGVRWFGHFAASGGYRMRGTGALAVLPFATDVEGLLRIRVLDDSDEWRLETPRPTTRIIDRMVTVRSPSGRMVEKEGSLDYVMMIGGWRPGW